jgi:hypothetical protein
MRDDASLDARGAVEMLQEALAMNALFLQQARQFLARFVAPNDAEQIRRGLERRQIAGHIRRAARHEAFALEINDRHWRLRRDARDTAPNELVQHHIPDHQHARPGGCAQKSADACGSENSGFHWRILIPEKP